jgi:tetratricopeptide (TPR) repeat protein
MATVTTWTGHDANALRRALRMSVTAFAEHLGAARRTVAKWSSQGDKVLPRADMQAALDTVLSRATPEVRERFDALRVAGTNGALVGAGRPDTGRDADTGDDGDGDSGSDGDVRRRQLLRGAAIGVAAAPNVASLLDALIAPAHPGGAALSLPQLSRAVAGAKTDYQACRYEHVLDRLVALLPSLEAVRSGVEGEQRSQVEVLAAELYHVAGSVLLKVGDQGMALVAAERSNRAAIMSQDPVAIAASARIMTHALMGNGHDAQAMTLAGNAADSLDRDTRLTSSDAVAVYGALVLRGAIAAARRDDRDTAHAMLDEATRAATRLGYDGNDRWTGFGATNVLLHRVNIALTLGDAGTAIAIARTVPLEKVTLAERKASLFVDAARAYTQWGRYEHGLNALRTAYEVAPEEIRCRPAVQRIAGDLAMRANGSVRTAAAGFAQSAGIRL